MRASVVCVWTGMVLLMLTAGSAHAQLRELPAPLADLSQSALAAPPDATAGLPSSAPISVALRLRLLDHALTAIHKHDRGRLFFGWLQLGLAGVLGSSLIWLDEPHVRAVLGTSAALSASRGVLQLVLSPDIEAGRRRFLAAPAHEPAAWQAKLAAGEAALRRAASTARKARRWDGSLTMAAAVAQVPLLWGLSRWQEPGYRFGSDGLDYVGLSLSIIAFASGLVHALVESDVERMERRYRALPR